MTDYRHDEHILHDLAKQYAELAAQPIQEERRQLWRAHLSLKKTRVPVLVTYGIWNVWCREIFGDNQMLCQDPFYREHERFLRMQIFHDSIGDDLILEPWITQTTTHRVPGGIYGEPWGAAHNRRESGMEGGS